MNDNCRLGTDGQFFPLDRTQAMFVYMTFATDYCIVTFRDVNFYICLGSIQNDNDVTPVVSAGITL